jgi:hypothetical protein
MAAGASASTAVRRAVCPNMIGKSRLRLILDNRCQLNAYILSHYAGIPSASAHDLVQLKPSWTSLPQFTASATARGIVFKNIWSSALTLWDPNLQICGPPFIARVAKLGK